MTDLVKPIGIEVDLEPLHAYNRALSGDVIWTTRYGQKMRVCHMESSHILNVIRMLKDESPLGTTYRCDDLTRHNWIEIMSLEAERRGLLV